MYLHSLFMNQITWKKVIREIIFFFLFFHIWQESWCRKMSNGLLAAIFVTVQPIFEFFTPFGFFWVLYQWFYFQRKIRSKKYVSDVGSIWNPLTTKGCTEDLDHLSVKSIGHLKKSSNIFSTFFLSFGDFGITRNLIFFS